MTKFIYTILMGFKSWKNTWFQRLLGLDCGKHLTACDGIRWPTRGLSRIHIGNNVSVGRNAEFWLMPINNTGQIVLEDDVYIADGVRIGAAEMVKIGSRTWIECRAMIFDYGKVFHHKSKLGRIAIAPQPVIIGKNCSVGAASLIKPGTVLGEGCVVGAHSVVSGVYPEGSVLVGNPAIVVRKINLALQTCKTTA